MSYKLKNTSGTEVVTCEKYINKMLRNEKMFTTKRSSSTTPTCQEKQPNVIKASAPVNNQRFKQKKDNIRQPNALKPVPVLLSNKQKESDNCNTQMERSSRKHRSTPRCRSLSSSDRESWGQILHKNLNKDKNSSFSIFDPLRTVHFLSKELYNKLQTLLPDDDNVIQMISDIQHALKRIPSEVTTALPPESDRVSVVKAPAFHKTCQTPPTLYQEDTEKFQKIMEENTYRLEASCQQLEMVCMNLQKEKEMTEKELEEATQNVEKLCKRIKDLEHQLTEVTHTKIKELEIEKENLQLELNRALQNQVNSVNINVLKKHIEELQRQKSASEENCTRLEYDITLLKMEKEKFITMLSVRDREIKEVQDEMKRIQEQVNHQLKKLNIEVFPKVNDLKNTSDPSTSVKEPNDNHGKIGDSTISSINTNDSDKEQESAYKEFTCGDAEIPAVTQDFQNDLMEKLSKIRSINGELLGDKKDSSFEELLKGLNPSCRTLLSSNN